MIKIKYKSCRQVFLFQPELRTDSFHRPLLRAKLWLLLANLNGFNIDKILISLQLSSLSQSKPYVKP